MKVIFKSREHLKTKEIEHPTPQKKMDLIKSLFTALKTIEEDLDAHLKKEYESNENIE